MVPGVGGGPAIWVYQSTDVHTDVDAASYFSNGGRLGMKPGDIVFVQDTDTDIRRETRLPEPGMLGILGAALAGIGFLRHRRGA